jgi:pilus assembly protein TadC
MALASGFWIAVLVRFPLGAFVGAGAGWGIHWVWARRSRTEGESRSHPLLLAAGWDLLAAGMRVGLPPAVILRAVAAEFTGVTAKILYEVAALHEWGADPVSAWEPALRHPDTAELARAARRSARTGSGIAELATDVAAAARAAVKEQTGKHAERAGVWVSAPLGLCFLPAFLCLGVLPVVLGMLQRLNFS